MKIDAEVYFWKYEKTFRHPLIRENKILQQHYLPDQIRQSLLRNGIEGCVAVVAEPAEVETRFLSELSLSNPFIYAVSGSINLFDPDVVKKIADFKGYGSIRSFRTEFRNDKLPEPAIMHLLGEYQFALEISLEGSSDIALLTNWIKAYPDQQFLLRIVEIRIQPNCPVPNGSRLFLSCENQISPVKSRAR